MPPEGWQRTPASQNDRLRFFDPRDEASQTGMFVTVAKDDAVEYPKFVERIKQALPRIVEGWKLTDEGSVELQGRPAYFVASTFRFQNKDAQQLQYFIRGDVGNFYVVTFTSDKATYSKSKKAFQDCAKPSAAIELRPAAAAEVVGGQRIR